MVQSFQYGAGDHCEPSTAAGAREFRPAKWLDTGLKRPQPALGGRKPADLTDTPTGIEVVSKFWSD
ncbi:MAG: DUF2384 domain-containing protein [Rhodoferax sp.]|nr:DUF2384 domain-containing protein [Rhodoferax sp.]